MASRKPAAAPAKRNAPTRTKRVARAAPAKGDAPTRTKRVARAAPAKGDAPTRTKAVARAAPSSLWYVYIARCRDDSLYCGIARDVAERIAKHDAGKGARYTRGRGPLKVEAVRKCATHGDALRLELAVKALPRAGKERLFLTRHFRALQRALT